MRRRWMFIVLLIVAIRLSALPLTSVEAVGLIEAEHPCFEGGRCWAFQADGRHVEGESEALNRGRSFPFDGRSYNGMKLTIHPGGREAVLVVEVRDTDYRQVKKVRIRAERPLKRSINLSSLQPGRYHIFVYFPRGGEAAVNGRLHYGSGEMP